MASEIPLTSSPEWAVNDNFISGNFLLQISITFIKFIKGGCLTTSFKSGEEALHVKSLNKIVSSVL